MKLFKEEKGSVIVIFALLLPVLIGIIGLTLDGGMLLYQRALLTEATEASAKSALLLSYDKDLWISEGKIVVDESEALIQGSRILKVNFDNAYISNIEIVNDVSIVIESKVEVEFSFMKIFGFDKKVLMDKQTYSLVE